MSHPDRDLTALLLAGGRSRRFGTDKARAAIAGTPMLRRVYEVAHALTPHVLLSVRSDGDFYFDLVPASVPRLLDPVQAAGPLAGLVAGLRAAQTRWLLVLACDLPLLTDDALRPILAACSAEADAIVPVTSDGHRQPLCALYRVATVQPVAEAQLTMKRYALQALLDHLSVVEWPLLDVLLHNVNTPGDLPVHRTCPDRRISSGQRPALGS